MTATTSGTIGTTQLDVIAIIDKASRRCGLLPGSISPELQLEAKSELFLSLSALANDGAPLWTVNKQVYGVRQNQNLLQFTTGTIDLQTVLYRYNVLPSGGTPFSSAGGVAANAFDQDVTTACTQTSINGYISYNFGSAVVITTAGVLMHSTQSLNPIYEYSTDGITWNTAIAAATQSSNYAVGQWYWLDVSAPQSAQYFRVRETGGGTLDFTEVVFGQKAREITIARSNKDDYQNLPNKNTTGRPLQYWFDRQIIPQAWLWPASNYDFNTLVVWSRRELQDVGAFTNILEFPNRWLDAIVSDLSMRLMLIIPGVDPVRMQVLQSAASFAMNRAWGEERDRSPLYITPNISCYTRR